MIGTAAFYLIFFGIATIGGGVMGFVKAKSKASLIAGSISGILLVVGGLLARQGNTKGLILGAIVSVLLLGRFGAVFAKSRVMVPAGIMCLLSVIGLVFSVTSLL